MNLDRSMIKNAVVQLAQLVAFFIILLIGTVAVTGMFLHIQQYGLRETWNHLMRFYERKGKQTPAQIAALSQYNAARRAKRDKDSRPISLREARNMALQAHREFEEGLQKDRILEARLINLSR